MLESGFHIAAKFSPNWLTELSDLRKLTIWTLGWQYQMAMVLFDNTANKSRSMFAETWVSGEPSSWKRNSRGQPIGKYIFTWHLYSPEFDSYNIKVQASETTKRYQLVVRGGVPG